MKLLLVLFSLCFTACAGVSYGFKYNKPQFYVAPELIPYYEMFVQEGASRHRSVAPSKLLMFFVPEFEKDFVVGQCQYGKIPTISILESFWETSTEAEKQQLILHELGHCVLKRDHKDASVVIAGEYIPASIMSEWMLDDYYYNKFRSYYLEELFGSR